MWNDHRDDGDFDLDSLLHPAQAFEHPDNVVNDPDLTLSEKRAMLASWASDACALEAMPALRRPPGAARPVSFDEIMDALRALDRMASPARKPKPHYRQVLAERRSGMSGRRQASDRNDHGPALN